MAAMGNFVSNWLNIKFWVGYCILAELTFVDGGVFNKSIHTVHNFSY
jgi:hypothetical protein